MGVKKRSKRRKQIRSIIISKSFSKLEQLKCSKAGYRKIKRGQKNKAKKNYKKYKNQKNIKNKVLK